MKSASNTNSYRLVGTALSMVLLMSGLALAGPFGRGPGGSRGGPMSPFGSHGPTPEMMVDHLAARLDLTEDQKESLVSAFAEQRELRQSQREAAQAAHETLQGQVMADVFDETAIRDAAAAVAEFQADRAVNRARFLEQVRTILSEEQWTEFVELRENKRERQGNRRGSRRGPWGNG